MRLPWTSWGEIIPGLYYGADKRWRIIATGVRFREEDERRAVQKLKTMTADPGVTIPLSTRATIDDVFADGPGEPSGDLRLDRTAEGTYTFSRDMPTAVMWAWVRQQLLSNPSHVAQMAGIPEIANLANLPRTPANINLEDLLAVYQR